MSFNADNPEHEVTLEDLLMQILKELKIKNMRDAEVTGVEISEDDLNE